MQKWYLGIFISFCVLSQASIAEPFVGSVPICASVGQFWVNQLEGASQSISTTNLRKEFKGPISTKSLGVILEDFEWAIQKAPHKLAIGVREIFTTRDPLPKKGVNATFTFYGQGFHFWYKNVKTKIKLRARFYLEKINHKLYLQNSLPYLEIKIKDPTPELKNTVQKYRLKIRLEDLAEIYSYSPQDGSLQHLVDNLVVENPDVKREQIKMLITAIENLSRFSKQFVRPQMGIYYERISKKFVEISEDAPIEFQMTLDRNIKGYKPSLFVGRGMLFAKYFQENLSKDLIVSYPKNAVVMEVKVPLKESEKPTKKRTFIHQLIDVNFIDFLRNQKNLLPGFLVDNGKASYVNAMIEKSEREL